MWIGRREVAIGGRVEAAREALALLEGGIHPHEGVEGPQPLVRVRQEDGGEIGLSRRLVDLAPPAPVGRGQDRVRVRCQVEFDRVIHRRHDGYEAVRQQGGDPLRILRPVALHREQVRRAQGEMVDEGGEHRFRPELPAGGEDRPPLHEDPAHGAGAALLVLDVGEIGPVVVQGDLPDGPAEPALVLAPAPGRVEVGGRLLPEDLIPILGPRTVDDRDLSCHEPPSPVRSLSPPAGRRLSSACPTSRSGLRDQAWRYRAPMRNAIASECIRSPEPLA